MTITGSDVLRAAGIDDPFFMASITDNKYESTRQLTQEDIAVSLQQIAQGHCIETLTLTHDNLRQLLSTAREYIDGIHLDALPHEIRTEALRGAESVLNPLQNLLPQTDATA